MKYTKLELINIIYSELLKRGSRIIRQTDNGIFISLNIVAGEIGSKKALRFVDFINLYDCECYGRYINISDIESGNF